MAKPCPVVLLHPCAVIGHSYHRVVRLLKMCKNNAKQQGAFGVIHVPVAHVPAEAKPGWFALYTSSRHEKHVSSQLQERQIETFLPVYRVIHNWKNRVRAELELPLFPSYVFVRITLDLRSKVLSVPGVLSLVGSKREAWPLPDVEMETLRSGLGKCRPEPHAYLAIGDRVRITDGPLQGMEGVLIERKNGSRVVLTLDQIMRSFSVEVDVSQLQPAPARLLLAS